MTGNSLMTSDQNKKLVENILFVIQFIREMRIQLNPEELEIKKMFLHFLESNLISFWTKCSDDERNAIQIDEPLTKIKLEAISDLLKLDQQFGQEYASNLKCIEKIVGDING
jgi:hypothetical protein